MSLWHTVWQGGSASKVSSSKPDIVYLHCAIEEIERWYTVVKGEAGSAVLASISWKHFIGLS